MKLFAFDLRANGGWRKQWDTLAAGFTVYQCSDTDENNIGINAINDTVKNIEKVLVLIHQGPCSSRIDIGEWKRSGAQGLFVMYVHGRGCSPAGAEPKWIYAAKRPVPTNSSLAYLSEEFASLSENLKKAVTEEEISAAWRAFDRNPVSELLETCSPIFVKSDVLPEVASHLGQVLNGKDEAWRKYAAAEVSRKVKGTVVESDGETLASTLLHSNGEAIVNEIRKKPGLTLGLARGCL